MKLQVSIVSRLELKLKYLIILRGILEPDQLSFLLTSLPPLPYDEASWNTARIFRDGHSGEVRTELSIRQLLAVINIWHKVSCDVLTLQRTKQLTDAAFEMKLLVEAQQMEVRLSNVAAILRWVGSHRKERTIRVGNPSHRAGNESLSHHRLCSSLTWASSRRRSLMGLLDKFQNRKPASIDDLEECNTALQRLHALGLLHGDVNRYKFPIVPNDVNLIDFEHSTEDASTELQSQELESLRSELVEDTGRGGEFVPPKTMIEC